MAVTGEAELIANLTKFERRKKRRHAKQRVMVLKSFKRN